MPTLVDDAVDDEDADEVAVGYKVYSRGDNKILLELLFVCTIVFCCVAVDGGGNILLLVILLLLKFTELDAGVVVGVVFFV